MIIETHGEVCRLGYLRLIASIARQEAPLTSDFIASVLADAVGKADVQTLRRREVGLIGMISSRVAARNYVTLAYGFGFLDRRTQRLGMNGFIYNALRSSSKFDAFLKGEADLSHRDLLTLNNVEKFLFLLTMIKHDYLMIPSLIKWVSEKVEISRMEGMNYVMEEVYPNALKLLIMTTGKNRRAELAAKFEEALKFGEKRRTFASKADWIKSSLYAKYRHIAPPRLEWLVDTGLLERSGRGRYVVSELLRRNSDTFARALSHSPQAIVEQLFANIAPLYTPYGGKATKTGVVEELIRSFQTLSGSSKRPVGMDLLELATCFRLLENNQLTTPKMVHDSLNNLMVVFPEKVFIAPGEGEKLEITRIDLGIEDLRA